MLTCLACVAGIHTACHLAACLTLSLRREAFGHAAVPLSLPTAQLPVPPLCLPFCLLTIWDTSCVISHMTLLLLHSFLSLLPLLISDMPATLGMVRWFET